MQSEGKKIHIDSLLQTNLSNRVIARSEATKQSQKFLSPKTSFEDLRRELVSRKYSHKTFKTYIYYNKNLLQFSDKKPSDINENDIKDYLLYLAEEKQSATSTLNQAINGLKLYYATMLKRRFFYKVKIPMKDKKLPVVLNQGEVSPILSFIGNCI